jgi:hypothetical protein
MEWRPKSAAKSIIRSGARKPRPGRSGCYSPRCLILCAVLALMCSRARGGRSSITRWSSTSVSRTSTHSSAYCASLASPNSSICRSLSSIALFWLGAGTPRRIPRPGLYALRSSFAPRSGGREDCYRELRRILIPRTLVNSVGCPQDIEGKDESRCLQQMM